MLRFTVYGTPQSQGSARAFMHKGAKFPTITSTNPKLKPWRQEVSGTALIEMQRHQLEMIAKKIPVRVRADFFFERPQSASKKLIHKSTQPDLDKLVRALLDSLTGIVYKDDSQVSQCDVFKFLGSPSRVEIIVTDTELVLPNGD